MYMKTVSRPPYRRIRFWAIALSLVALITILSWLY